MKLFRDYKRQFSFIVAALSVFTFVMYSHLSFAETADDIRAQINQKDADIQHLEQQIAAYQSELDDLGKQKDTLNGSLKELDITKKKLTVDITVTESKIARTNLKIENLSNDIGDKEKVIKTNEDSVAESMRNTFELEQGNIISQILSDDNITSVWNDIDNIASIRDTFRANIKTLKQLKGELEDTRVSTISAKDELVALQSQLLDQKKIIIQNANEKASLLKQTKNNESNYQKLLNEGLAKKVALEKEINDYEARLKYILDPSKLPGRVLSWPLDYILVTSPYGQRTNEYHYGVDFRASMGTPVMAMADGVVGGVGNTDTSCPRASYGQFIFIKYNNGLSSTFGHLSLIKVHNGEAVSRGEVVGYSGNSGYSLAPHLHVSVYVSDAVSVQTIPSKACVGQVLTQPISPHNANIDPLKYLPPTTAAQFKNSQGGSD